MLPQGLRRTERLSRVVVWIVEIKDRAELDLPQKMPWLGQWWVDATAACVTDAATDYRFVYVDQRGFGRRRRTDSLSCRPYFEHMPQLAREN